MRNCCLWLLLALCLSVTCVAQSDSCKQRKIDVVAEAADGRSTWTREALDAHLFKYMTYFVDCVLWDKDVHKKLRNYETDWKPTVRVDTLGSGVRSPYVQGTQISYPTEFARYLLEIGVLLGHDACVRRGSIHLPYELSSTPFRRTPLVPLLTPLNNYLQPDVFEMIRVGLQAPPTDSSCTFIYDSAAMAPMVFVLLHENAHQRLHHSSRDGLHLSQELEADASALAAMNIIRDEGFVGAALPDNDKDVLRWIFEVAPALWLKVDLLRLGPDGAEAAARLKAALDAQGSVSREVREYTTPEHHSDNLAILHVHIDHPVQRYVIDGRLLLPSELPLDGLVVTNAIHTVVALCSDGVGVSRKSGEPQFVFANYDAVATDKVQRDADQGKWEQVLAETSSITLAPRLDDLTALQAHALENLGLAIMISSHALATLTIEDLQTAQKAQQEALPLSTWHYTQDRNTVP